MPINRLLLNSYSWKASGNTSLGRETLESHGLNFDSYFYWISIGVLIGMTVLFNVGFTLALTFMKGKFVFHFITLSLLNDDRVSIRFIN